MSTQVTVFNWLKAAGGKHKLDEIAAGTDLDRIQVQSALSNLRRKEVADCEGITDKSWWTIADELVIRASGGSNKSSTRQTSKLSQGERAMQRFKESIKEMMEAWIGIEPYFVTEDKSEELTRLQEFERQVLLASTLMKKHR